MKWSGDSCIILLLCWAVLMCKSATKSHLRCRYVHFVCRRRVRRVSVSARIRRTRSVSGATERATTSRRSAVLPVRTPQPREEDVSTESSIEWCAPIRVGHRSWSYFRVDDVMFFFLLLFSFLFQITGVWRLSVVAPLALGECDLCVWCTGDLEMVSVREVRPRSAHQGRQRNRPSNCTCSLVQCMWTRVWCHFVDHSKNDYDTTNDCQKNILIIFTGSPKSSCTWNYTL